MGNNPSSTSKPPTPVAASNSNYQSEPPRNIRRDHKSPISPHTPYGIAAPPEPSHAQAQGSTANRSNSLHPAGVSSWSGSAAPSNIPIRPSSYDPKSFAPATTTAAAAAAAAATPPRDEPSKPVDVPHSATTTQNTSNPTTSSPTLLPHAVAQLSGTTADILPISSISDMSYLTRPPRLPLPIEEELHTPGSPILPAAEIGDIGDADKFLLDGSQANGAGGPMGSNDSALATTNIDQDDENSDGITRKLSALSSTTEDEEAEWRSSESAKGPRVPVTFEWADGGEKVYVTGTIFEWTRKHRLTPVEGKHGVFATTVFVTPGTHHVRFIVDGVMLTSSHLPTTVDFGNNLVNYVVVEPAEGYEDQPEDSASNSRDPRKTGKDESVKKRTKLSEEEDTEGDEADDQDQYPKAPKTRYVPSPDQYISAIPQYLIDYDLPEESPAYQHAYSAIDKLPTPPSLPGFLSKPILNMPTREPEDNSILPLPPNHTILNHLATSSIKNNVLAVSATTRYKNKYVTAIIYKPSMDDEP